MTDLPPHDPYEDDLLLDAFDGDPDAIAAVAAEPRLTIALNEMRHHRDALTLAAGSGGATGAGGRDRLGGGAGL